MNSPVCRLNISNDERDLEHWLVNQGLYERELVRSEYITRKLYGKYLRWRFDYPNLKLKKVDRNVNRVVPNGLGYVLEAETEKFNFDYVIVAIGSQENPSFDISPSNENYFHSIYSNLSLLEDKLTDPNNNIAILGTSSAFLDVMRLFQHLNLTDFPKLYAISKSGNIPWPGVVNENVNYELTLLNETTDLKHVVELLEKEITIAFENNISILDIRAEVNAWLKNYFKTLTEEQKERFMANAARSFESLMKRGAPLVVNYTRDIIIKNKLSIISKKIKGLKENENGELSIVFDEDELKVDCVLNCLGSTGISNSNSKVIVSLMKDCGCNPSASQSGFKVDNNYQLNDKLFACGPIITGSFNLHETYHHLENIRKIYELSLSFISEFKKICSKT